MNKQRTGTALLVNEFQSVDWQYFFNELSSDVVLVLAVQLEWNCSNGTSGHPPISLGDTLAMACTNVPRVMLLRASQSGSKSKTKLLFPGQPPRKCVKVRCRNVVIQKLESIWIFHDHYPLPTNMPMVLMCQ